MFRSLKSVRSLYSQPSLMHESDGGGADFLPRSPALSHGSSLNKAL